MSDRILALIDFSEATNAVVAAATKLAVAVDAEVLLLHVVEPDPDFVGYEVGPQYIRDSRAAELRKEHRQLQEYANKLNKNGANTEALLVQGATIEMVIEEAKKLNIDLIITGHHEHNYLYQAFVGSVSAEIIKRSKIPVLLVPIE